MTATFTALLPARAPQEVTVEQLLEELLLDWRRGADLSSRRPFLALNMISTADGRATLNGRSGPLGNPADKALFHGLRTLVDAVLVGAQTLRVERYNRIVADDAARRRRAARGLAPEPWACVVSASLALEPTIALLADPGARVLVLTPSPGTLPATAAPVQYVRAARNGQLDLARALRELRSRLDIHTVLCEGGPHLARSLLAAGLVDELFLTLAPTLVAGDIASTPAGTRGARVHRPRSLAELSVLSGAPLLPPPRMHLRGLLERDSYLFVRYRIVPA
jgi:riboflavin biosynthesis pyrimidine reductase